MNYIYRKTGTWQEQLFIQDVKELCVKEPARYGHYLHDIESEEEIYYLDNYGNRHIWGSFNRVDADADFVERNNFQQVSIQNLRNHLSMLKGETCSCGRPSTVHGCFCNYQLQSCMCCNKCMTINS